MNTTHETDLGPGRPDADECLPYYFQYIRLVPDGHVVARLERQIGESAAFVAGFTPEQARRREAPGEWNAVEIVGHLIDTERVFGYRALRIARADPVMWTSGPPSWRSCVAWTRRPGRAARRQTGPCAACAPSPTPWPATSSITWRTSAASTAGSRPKAAARETRGR